MKRLFVGAAALVLACTGAIAQPVATSGLQALSLEQQSKISEIVTNQTPKPLTNIDFPIAADVVVPSSVALQRLPAEVEKQAPQLQGYSYVAVEELVAIIDTNSRKIVSVMQRMRPQNDIQSAR